MREHLDAIERDMRIITRMLIVELALSGIVLGLVLGMHGAL